MGNSRNSEIRCNAGVLGLLVGLGRRIGRGKLEKVLSSPLCFGDLVEILGSAIGSRPQCQREEVARRQFEYRLKSCRCGLRLRDFVCRFNAD